MAKGALRLAFCIVSVFCRVHQQASIPGDSKYCNLNNCSGLCFESHHNGLQPCLKCTEEEVNATMFNEKCKNGIGRKVSGEPPFWCDGDFHSLPRCPNISMQVQCQNTVPRYEMVCGDICSFMCNGERVSVMCTEQLTWNDTIPNPTQCSQTTAGGAADSPLAVTVIIVTAVICVVLGACVLFGAFIIYRKCMPRIPDSSDRTSVAGASDLLLPESQNTIYSIQKSSHPYKPDEGQSAARPCNHIDKPVGVRTIEDQAGKVFVDIQQNQSPRENLSSVESRLMLSDFLDDMTAAKQLSECFDQQDRFNKITWHLIASHLLKWATDKVTHVEYQCRSSTTDLGDSPTYRVLRTFMQEGKGMDELVDFLKHHESCLKADNGPEAVKLLQSYEREWRNERKKLNSCV